MNIELDMIFLLLHWISNHSESSAHSTVYVDLNAVISLHVIRIPSITISIVDIRNMGVFHSVLLFLSPLSFPPHRPKNNTNTYQNTGCMYCKCGIHFNSIGIELVSHFVIVHVFFSCFPFSLLMCLSGFLSINQSNWFKFWIIKIFASILVGCIIFVPTKYISGSNMYGWR